MRNLGIDSQKGLAKGLKKSADQEDLKRIQASNLGRAQRLVWSSFQTRLSLKNGKNLDKLKLLKINLSYEK